MSSSRHCRCDQRSLFTPHSTRSSEWKVTLKWFICSCDHRSAMAAAAAAWDVPAIESAGALADWLLLDHGELAWFADLKGLGYKRNRTRWPRPRRRGMFPRSSPPERWQTGFCSITASWLGSPISRDSGTREIGRDCGTIVTRCGRNAPAVFDRSEERRVGK